jgi:hypothetical protein
MFRRIIVTLSIVNLLVCPLVCTGIFRCAAQPVTNRTAACNCGMCEHSREVPPGDFPPADHSCDSCQCVCGGAVSTKDTNAENIPCIGMLPAIDSVAYALVFNSRTNVRVESAGRPPGPGSGRMLRLEIESLLC